jgi:hypothetical protein
MPSKPPQGPRISGELLLAAAGVAVLLFTYGLIFVRVTTE